MRILLSFLLMLAAFSGCRRAPDEASLLKKLETEVVSGNLYRAMAHADSLKGIFEAGSRAFITADSLGEIARRIKVDFSLAPEAVVETLSKKMGPVTPDQIAEWEKTGWIDFRIIDGRKMYFKRDASNVLLLKAFYEKTIIPEDEESTARRLHTDEILNSSNGKGNVTMAKKLGIVYTITVEENAVPENETVRCWLPWPRSDQKRQGGIRLLSTSQPDYFISPDSAVHSTLYMEKKAVKGAPTVFSITYEYESSAQWFDPGSIIANPYNKDSQLYHEFTREQLPHINFSPEIRRLADSICGDEKDPALNMFGIWRWFKENIPWTGAIEYSILPDITAYACANRRGDCGIQTMMFMSMLRYRGIPVRWQSGWKVPPFGKNLHDWCEVYFEGTGWLPVDVSYDLQNSGNRDNREYFMTGIDSYRLIVNNGMAGNLFPRKRYLRSEPYDFQRGEVEWNGGNLYFDRWDYEMEIEYK